MLISFNEWQQMKEAYTPETPALFQQLMSKLQTDPQNQQADFKKMPISPLYLKKLGFDPQRLMQAGVIQPHSGITTPAPAGAPIQYTPENPAGAPIGGSRMSMSGYQLNKDLLGTGGKMAAAPAPPPPSMKTQMANWLKQAQAQQPQRPQMKPLTPPPPPVPGRPSVPPV